MAHYDELLVVSVPSPLMIDNRVLRSTSPDYYAAQLPLTPTSSPFEYSSLNFWGRLIPLLTIPVLELKVDLIRNLLEPSLQHKFCESIKSDRFDQRMLQHSADAVQTLNDSFKVLEMLGSPLPRIEAPPVAFPPTK